MFNCSKIIEGLTSINKLAQPLSVSLYNVTKYSKQAKIFNKLMTKGISKKRRWHNFEPTLGGAHLPAPSSISHGPQSNKRVVVLNKLFMKHITDLLVTGKCSDRVNGKGIEVTKVKVSADYSVVNVYWMGHGEHTEKDLDSTLKRAAGELREELIGLNVMGKVPYIQFVKDRSIAAWSTVENILRTADMGEDYVPTGMSPLKCNFGNEFLEQPLSADKVVPDDLPPMRQNVLGLDRDAIMERILASTKSHHKKTHVLSGTSQSKYQPFDEKAFAQFLLSRKLERDHLAKYRGMDNSMLENENSFEVDDVDPSSLVDDDYLDDSDDEMIER